MRSALDRLAGDLAELNAGLDELEIAGQEMDRLNATVAFLAIALIGPTVVFGALSVTEFWLPSGDYPTSVALLLAYVLVGLALSAAIAKCIAVLTGGFFTRSAPRVRGTTGESAR